MNRLDTHRRTLTTLLSTRQITLLAVLLIGISLAVADLFVTTLSVALLLFAGLLFGVFLHALSVWPTRHTPISYRASYLIVVTLLILLIVGGTYYMGSQIGQRVDDFTSQLQQSIQTTDQKISQIDWANRNFPSIEDLRQRILESTGSVLPKMFQGLQMVGWGITGAFVIFFVGLYAAYDPDLYRNGLVKMTSKRNRSRYSEVLKQTRTALGQWLMGRFMSMAVVGIATAIALWILGVPLAFSLGVLAAFLTFIPNIGPLLAAIPQMLLAVNLGTQTVIYVLVFNVALQMVESYLITPMIQKHEVSLPPVLTIASQLIMGVWAGIIGIMMAAPLVVVAMVGIQMLYVHDRLGDDHPGELAEQ
ncbi:AI-2E family transporter [Neorhodopirellula pilleata]|uniref:Pheromone autoinducer 2 transporter n=1 Tax=Neorhodopirellula pilleata TaxID=2714738 RepID=A0A5C5ZFN6_9BACT|nr:AI-2E family transporter [Neorhodopirellula pilleata]TWT86132.1 pheromone autoinducer 2 transporter [Neorhodopirellula pilleata]